MDKPNNIRDVYNMLGEDFDIVLSRLMKEERVEKYLKMFVRGSEMDELDKALAAEDWETAFRASHTVKGVAANLGLLRLGRLASDLCEELRPCVKPVNDISELIAELKEKYKETVETVTMLG